MKKKSKKMEKEPVPKGRVRAIRCGVKKKKKGTSGKECGEEKEHPPGSGELRPWKKHSPERNVQELSHGGEKVKFREEKDEEREARNDGGEEGGANGMN